MFSKYHRSPKPPQYNGSILAQSEYVDSEYVIRFLGFVVFERLCLILCQNASDVASKRHPIIPSSENGNNFSFPLIFLHNMFVLVSLSNLLWRVNMLSLYLSIVYMHLDVILVLQQTPFIHLKI